MRNKVSRRLSERQRLSPRERSVKCTEELLSPTFVIVAPAKLKLMPSKETKVVSRRETNVVSDIILSETATIMFKSTNSLAPEYLSELFVKNSALNTMRLRNTEADLRVPLFKTANGQKSISFRGPKLWNQLSSDVRLAPSLSTFKRRFKDVVEG